MRRKWRADRLGGVPKRGPMFGVDTPTVKAALLAGGVVAALVAMVLARRPRRQRADDLGAISEQWIAEHKRGRD